MKAPRVVAKAPTRFAIEMFKVQIYLVVKIGREIVARVRCPGAHGEDSIAHFGRKLIDMFLVPEVVFGTLTARACHPE
jgi:hypothetical protein